MSPFSIRLLAESVKMNIIANTVFLLKDPQVVNYFLIPLMIFLLRVCDVSIGTIRIISISRGLKLMASVMGFFEVLIWLFAIGQIMQNLTNGYNYIAFAAGFAAGNYVGILIEAKISMGVLMMRIITPDESESIAHGLRSAGCGVTRLVGNGAHGPVNLIFTVIKRKDLIKVSKIIKDLNPNAFYTVEEIKSINHPPFALHASIRKGTLDRLAFARRIFSRMTP